MVLDHVTRTERMELDDGELVAAKRIEHLATKLQIGSELSSWNFALQPFGPVVSGNEPRHRLQVASQPRMDMKDSITPGEILLEEYLKPMGISQNAMARAIGVSPRAINEIVLGRRSITPPMSIRFGAFFGQSDKFWHGIQVECDFRKLAGRQEPTDSRHIKPAAALAARGESRHGIRPALQSGER